MNLVSLFISSNIRYTVFSSTLRLLQKKSVAVMLINKGPMISAKASLTISPKLKECSRQYSVLI